MAWLNFSTKLNELAILKKRFQDFTIDYLVLGQYNSAYSLAKTQDIFIEIYSLLIILFWYGFIDYIYFD